MVEEITENVFKEKIASGNVVVDFFAQWCGPCRMLSPVIDELAKEISNYSFYKLNVDEAENIAMEYGIMSIPTILIFKDGNLVNKLVGLRSKSELINELK